jgi:hypothetical protein
MTDVNPYVVALFVVIVAGCLVSIVCARVAHRRTRDAWSAPAATLDTAVELLSVAAILTAAAWFVALRPTDG